MDTKNIYLDTNIVLDMIDTKRVNYNKSIELGQYLLFNDYQIIISEDMLSTIFYISKGSQDSLLFLKEVVLVDWQIVPFGKDIIGEAIELSLKDNLDLEDTLQCLCAKNNGCNTLITHDNKFYDCGVDILTIDKFMEKYNAK